MIWETVIGLEVHAQLKTRSKLFSGAATAYGARANSQTSFVDAGLPGVLPVLNQAAVQMAIQFGLAINAQINDLSFFERKNYFYPDLPKGYQISQFQRPIVQNGHVTIDTQHSKHKIVHIARAHLEEDAGKSLHDAHPMHTGIDLNRAGTPLLEIVTTPCLYSADEVVTYLKVLHQLLRFLDICDGNMQEGSFRCDVNISLRPQGEEQLGTRTEVKNLNSFRFIEKAILYEQRRHQDLLEMSQKIIQQTRLYSPDTDQTYAMRDKENENDYRYFPDPDLLPIRITSEDIAQIKENLPTLPMEIKHRLVYTDQLSEDDTEFLLSSPKLLQFYDEVKRFSSATAKMIVNWLKGPYLAALNEHGHSTDKPPVSAERLGCLLSRHLDGTISAKTAKIIFVELMQGEDSVDEIIAAGGYQQIHDNSLFENMIKSIIQQYPQQAADYRAGKEKLMAFFVGQIMKQTKGQGNPEQINALLRKYLVTAQTSSRTQ
jgi:aspartyl-tRNA(Asn)/glutamyl-tRNA(Gln) amidotransferase subunit B